MFQEFYKDTLGSRYIKSLLAQTPVPVFESVVNGDLIIAGCYYVYKRFIIKCNSSGILLVDEQREELTPSNTLYPSVFLFPATGYQAATFYVKSIVDEYNPKTHAKFMSKTNYYDPDTHYQLGRYLRYELTKTGLNLFPFYNCYNGKTLSDVELSIKNTYYVEATRTPVQKYKIVAVPILFGHTYTVAIDCPTRLLARAIVYDDSGYIDSSRLPEQLVADLYNSGQIHVSTRFDKPFKFRVETDSFECYMFQKNLYLVLQLPLNNDSSIVVLENYEEHVDVECNEDYVREYNIVNPSLLAMNHKKTYAFSDRLIEYLVGNVVYMYDPISLNISHAQAALASCFYDYKRTFIKKQNKYGVWDDDIHRLILNLVEQEDQRYNLYDQDGNINKDILKVLVGRGGKVE